MRTAHLPRIAFSLLAAASAAAQGVPSLIIEEQEQIVLEVRYVVTGAGGAEIAAVDERAVPISEVGRFERIVDLARGDEAPEPVVVELAIVGSPVDESHLELSVTAAVMAEGADADARVRTGRILDGGSLIMDLHASGRAGARRLLAIVEANRRTVPLVERREADLRPVDLVLDVSFVTDDTSLLLEKVRMTTLPGRAVEYAFRLHLPAEALGGEAGAGVVPVSVTVRTVPRRLADGRVDLLVILEDPRGRPWTTGEPLLRTVRRNVEPGEGASLDLVSVGGALTYRFSVSAYY